jgi:hypothetical protein
VTHERLFAALSASARGLELLAHDFTLGNTPALRRMLEPGRELSVKTNGDRVTHKTEP